MTLHRILPRFAVLLLLALVLPLKKGLSQEPLSAFDSVYIHTATTLSALDKERAIVVADSLFKNAENSLQEMKSLMLLATLEVRAGKKAEALSHAMEAEEIAKKDRNPQWRIRIAGFLSSTFREVGLVAEGKRYLAIAESALKRLREDEGAISYIQGLLHQEKAYYRIEEGDYKSAIGELNNAATEFLKIEDKTDVRINLATNNQLLGNSHLALQKYEIAEEKLNAALAALGDRESELKAFIYVDLAEVAMVTNHYEDAFGYYKQAESYMSSSDNFNIKVVLYKGLSKYYRAVHNETEAVRYNDLYAANVNQHLNLTSDISNQLISQLGLEKEHSRRQILLLGVLIIVLILLTVSIILFFKRSQRKEREKYEGVLLKIKDSKQPKRAIKEVRKEKSQAEGTLMAKETEERILSDLNELEAECFYLQKDVSLSSLSVRLNTNSKYLSFVINTHKGKDFNNYINQLRIDYVIDRLRNEPEYLDYKLSYIADACGFSSHSKFAAVFKSLVGLSPSVFISHLKKDLLQQV